MVSWSCGFIIFFCIYERGEFAGTEKNRICVSSMQQKVKKTVIRAKYFNEDCYKMQFRNKVLKQILFSRRGVRRRMEKELINELNICFEVIRRYYKKNTLTH